jgi:hypothetical protein
METMLLGAIILLCCLVTAGCHQNSFEECQHSLSWYYSENSNKEEKIQEKSEKRWKIGEKPGV